VTRTRRLSGGFQMTDVFAGITAGERIRGTLTGSTGAA